MSLIRKKKN